MNTPFRKGQSSVELLIVLAISLVILGATVQLATEQLSNFQKQQAVQLVQDSLGPLIQGINRVYEQGPAGAGLVELYWPPGIVEGGIDINGSSILVNLYNTQVIGTAIPFISGTLPISSGKHNILIQAIAGGVYIHQSTLSAGENAIYVPMVRDSNETSNITITNSADENVTITYTADWNHSEVGLTLPDDFIIDGGSLDTSTFLFSSTSTASGNYTGTITLTGTYTEYVETIILPVNVEVFVGTGTLLTIFPPSISLSTFGDDTNATTIQLCNIGETALKTISVQPSNDTLGNWVQSIATIDTIAGASCVDQVVTTIVPSGTALGNYSGTLFVSDFTGANSTVVPLSVSVKGMADYFSWDWNTTTLNTTSFSGFTLHNNGSKTLTAIEMVLEKWDTCDSSAAELTIITLDGSRVYMGSAADGETINITDFSLTAGETVTNNSIFFDNSINDENEQFRSLVTFSDGTIYTSSTYGNGCNLDITPPGSIASFSGNSGSIAESIQLLFTFPGDDGNVGAVSSADFRWSTDPITDITDFGNATPLTYDGSFLPAGNDGNFLVNDLNVGHDYYFGVIFKDEADLNSDLATTSAARPWNAFNYSSGELPITPFISTFSGTPPAGSIDINAWNITNIQTNPSGDRNMLFRVRDDTNSANTWVVSLRFAGDFLTNITVWYPVTNTSGVPSSRAKYQRTLSQAYDTGLDLLDSSLIVSNYRYNGSSVNIAGPTTMYMDILDSGFSDVNVVIDGAGA